MTRPLTSIPGSGQSLLAILPSVSVSPSPSGCARGAQVWACEARSARFGTRRLPYTLALVALLLGVGALSGQARAAEASATSDAQQEPPATAEAPSKPSGLWPSVATHVTLSLSTLSEDDMDQAQLLLGGLDLELALGGRVGSSSRLAYELALGVRSVLDVVQHFEQPPGYNVPTDESLTGSLTYVLPLGACFDLLPDSPSGFFGSAHVGLGWFDPPPFIPTSEFHVAGRLALDAGWQLQVGDSSRLGLSVRYSALGLKRVYIDEAYNNALVSHELSLGAVWHLP